jgi:hypothetical protein
MLRLYSSLVLNMREQSFQSQAALGCLRVKPPAGFDPAGGYKKIDDQEKSFRRDNLAGGGCVLDAAACAVP